MITRLSSKRESARAPAPSRTVNRRPAAEVHYRFDRKSFARQNRCHSEVTLFVLSLSSSNVLSSVARLRHLSCFIFTFAPTLDTLILSHSLSLSLSLSVNRLVCRKSPSKVDLTCSQAKVRSSSFDTMSLSTSSKQFKHK
jgi:hypothetical protein